MLETTAGNSCKGLQNMNFCSKNIPVTGICIPSRRTSQISTFWKDLGGGTLHSPSRAMKLLKQAVCELGVAYAILYL